MYVEGIPTLFLYQYKFAKKVRKIAMPLGVYIKMFEYIYVVFI